MQGIAVRESHAVEFEFDAVEEIADAAESGAFGHARFRTVGADEETRAARVAHVPALALAFGLLERRC